MDGVCDRTLAIAGDCEEVDGGASNNELANVKKRRMSSLLVIVIDD